jgi:hypothetical protein
MISLRNLPSTDLISAQMIPWVTLQPPTRMSLKILEKKCLSRYIRDSMQPSLHMVKQELENLSLFKEKSQISKVYFKCA